MFALGDLLDQILDIRERERQIIGNLLILDSNPQRIVQHDDQVAVEQGLVQARVQGRPKIVQKMGFH